MKNMRTASDWRYLHKSLLAFPFTFELYFIGTRQVEFQTWNATEIVPN